MKMTMGTGLWLVMLALTVGSGFCFTVHDQENFKSKQRSVRDLKRRYWGDDVQPCIAKYCYKMTGLRYVKCLKNNCPVALLMIPKQLNNFRRELDVEYDVAPAQQQQINTVMSDLEHTICTSTSPHLAARASHSTSYSTGTEPGRQMTYYDVVLKNIEFARCSDEKCAAFADDSEMMLSCTAQSCCKRNTQEAPRQPEPRHHWEPTSALARKRRINDDMSQCIQSYCNGRDFRDRVMCIVKNCNRIKRF